MPNIWVGPDDAKRRKNGEGLRWPKNKYRVATIKAGKYLAQKNQWPVTKTRSYRLGKQ